MTKTEEIIRSSIEQSKDPFVTLAAEMYGLPSTSINAYQRAYAKASAYQYLYGSGQGPADLKEVFHRG